MADLKVPPYFLCPISLEMMKDPVTLSTGITYDRESIEKWLFAQKHNTCPVTKQAISDPIDLTPNHTLRRLIQSWCTINAQFGVERFPTPRLPISKPQILKLLKDSNSPHLQMKTLKRLKTIVMENETNKRVMEASGAADYMVSILRNHICNGNGNSESGDELFELVTPADEAVSILYHLQMSETRIKALFGPTQTETGKSGDSFVEVMTRFMQRAANYESRTYAILLLKTLFESAADPNQMVSLKPEVFTEIVRILTDEISKKATKAALKLLAAVCPWGRNRIKAVEAGAVPVLIDALLDSPEKRVSEMVLTVLDQLCQCAEGRAELLKHGAGLAVVSKKVFRVSPAASERAVRVLYSVAKFSGNASVVQEMLQLGVVGKLCLALQVDCGSKIKGKAREILKMHARAWKNSSCIPNNLISSYPS